MIRGYTADWTWAENVAASSTTTTMASYRASDDHLALRFNLICGSSSGGNGINCDELASGSANPQGGAGCIIDMGTSSSADYHRILPGRVNSDTYLYICNGPQHSSSNDMNHRVWFRTSPPPAPPSASCKDLLDSGFSIGSGQYQITPIGGETPVTVECDMSRAGGGWTLGIKHWMSSGLQNVGAAASGDVSNALKKKGSPYKLSDEHIKAIIGSDKKFDILVDQAGYNTAYSAGNYE